MSTKYKKIFITIPAYNDPLLVPTIEKALSNALYPDNLFFCIGMQYDEDKLPDISKYVGNKNFEFIFYDVKSRPGVYWIRREMASRHKDQDYFLMIDSHMSFAKFWDAILINDYEDLRRLHGDRTVITRPTMPEVGATLQVITNSIDDRSHWMVNWNNDQDSIERTILPTISTTPWDGTRFVKTLVSCSHLFFTNSNYIYDVGFHEGIRSYCEEYTIATTSFLSGWDLYMMPEFTHIGHDDLETHRAIYGKDKYTLGDGKRYQALFETDQEKMEISKFLFLDNSSMFKVRNQRRSIDQFYDEAGEDLQQAKQRYLELLNIKNKQ